MTCPYAALDGSYILGALGPGERHEYEAHLPACAECAASVRELAGLPGLLARVDLADLSDDPAPGAPPDILPALLRSARRESRRRTALTSLAAAACVAALAGGAVAAGGGLAGRPGSAAGSPTMSTTPTAPGRPMAPVGQSVMTAALALTSVAWGTRLDLTCTYAEEEASGSPTSDAGDGHEYALVVRTREGRDEQVATWRALPGRSMRLTGATATLRSDIGEVQVRSATGRLVLSLPVAG